MGRETKTFRKRVESPPVSPHLEIVPTNLPLFFFFFLPRGASVPLSPHSSADLTATEVHVTKETLHLVQHSCTAHCQGQKRQQVPTTSRIPFPIVRGLRWWGDGVLRILCITMMPEKHHSMVTIWGERGDILLRERSYLLQMFPL